MEDAFTVILSFMSYMYDHAGGWTTPGSRSSAKAALHHHRFAALLPPCSSAPAQPNSSNRWTRVLPHQPRTHRLRPRRTSQLRLLFIRSKSCEHYHYRHPAMDVPPPNTPSFIRRLLGIKPRHLSEILDDNPISKKTRRQLRNRDAAERSRKRRPE
ncbi:hypothetical protein FF1_035428 [Malus domestica]